MTCVSTKLANIQAVINHQNITFVKATTCLYFDITLYRDIILIKQRSKYKNNVYLHTVKYFNVISQQSNLEIYFLSTNLVIQNICVFYGKFVIPSLHVITTEIIFQMKSCDQTEEVEQLIFYEQG